MGNEEHFGRSVSVAIVMTLVFTLALPNVAFAGNSGVSSLTGVGEICAAARNAVAGNPVDGNGNAITFTIEACAGKSARAQMEPSCQKPLSQLVAAGKNIDSLCESGTNKFNQATIAYCHLRHQAKTAQLSQYCQAYEAADRAQKGVRITAALDVAAAASCWAEYLTQKAAAAAGGSSAGSVGNMGICGGAAMAAATAEFVQTAKVLSTTAKDGGGTNIYDEDHHTVGNKSAGALRIDSDDKVVARGNFAKTVEVILSAGLSLKALQVGLCYYSPKMSICSKIQQGRDSAHANKKLQVSAENKLFSSTTFEEVADGTKGVNAARAKQAADANVRADLAKQAAIIFTGLTAMRATALVSAASTKSKAADIITSQFESWFSSGPSFGTSGVSNLQLSMFSAGGGSTFSPNGSQGVNTFGATAAGTPEGYLLPPGSPQNNAAAKIASQIPSDKMDKAAAGGAAGVAGLISSVASGMGAKDTSAIHAAMQSAFAGLPKVEGDYSSGGGGKSLASKGDSAPDLNLKGLFGDKEKEEHAAAASDLAYRGLASDDIWHSRNPRGNNLFQIVSEKYDTVQRKRDLNP